MKTNIKRGIVSGAVALSLLGGSAAGIAAQQPAGGAESVAFAQSEQRTNVGQVVSGLINVNVGAVAVNIGDITVEDVIDVNNVLNNNEVRILNNVLNNSPILSNNSEILTNLLRDANIITDNQIVVGVLGGTFLVQDV